MKHKFLLISAIFMLIGASAFAQRQKQTERFLAEFDWNFVGDYTYQYILQENGTQLMDGPFTMVANLNEKGLPYGGRHKINVVGKYNLKGSHVKGNLHGPLTLDANLSINATNGDKLNATYTFRGNFKNGIPDGNFKVDYPTSHIKVNVNYKDSILVGAYYVKGIDDRSLPFVTSGTLTSKGKPTGTWKFEGVSSTTEITYSNGVVVNRSDYDQNLRAKAKSYAAGTITKEQLQKENICVKSGTLELGSDAWNHILANGIEFKKMGGYSFGRSKLVEYEYLDRLPTFSKEGYEKCKEIILDPTKVHDKNFFESYGCAPQQRYEFYNGIIGYDKTCGLYYCRLSKYTPLSQYCVGYPDFSEGSIEEIYFSNEQIAELSKLLHEARMKRVDQVSLSQLELHISYDNRGRIASDFMPCIYDENIVTYYWHKTGKEDLLYISRDVYEDYFIGRGFGGEIQKVTPESRQEIVKAKIEKKEEQDRKEQEAKRLASQKQYCNSASEWFKQRIIGKEKSSYSRFIESRDWPDSLFPIISYEAKEAILCDRSEEIACKVISRINVTEQPAKRNDKESPASNNSQGSIFGIFKDILPQAESSEPKSSEPKSSSPQKLGYKTYEMTVYFDGSDRISYRLTFDPSNFVRVENEYDIIRELDSKIETNNKKLKELSSTAFKKDYKAYNSYFKGLELSVNHDDLNASIDDRKKVLEVQDVTFRFIEKLELVNKGDEDVISKSSELKDVLKAYKSYMPTRDLSWSSDCKTEKLDEYLAVQAKCVEFIALRDVVKKNDETLKSLKSSAPYMYKLYTKYGSGCNLAWSADVDFATIKTLIDTQEKLMSALKKDGISAIDKNIKKQKIEDIIQILDMPEVK